MFHLQRALLIAVGGSVGSVGRYYVQLFLSNRGGVSFPYGTLVVNLTGCALIGFILSLLLRHETWSDGWRFFFAVGICGGYTTFSAFSWDAFQLFKTGHWTISLAYLLISVIGGLFTLWIGTVFARFF